MRKEQARQEAERRVDEFYKYCEDGNNGKYYDSKKQYSNAIKCAIISINREIDLCRWMYYKSPSAQTDSYISEKVKDLNQIKEELLKM